MTIAASLLWGAVAAYTAVNRTSAANDIVATTGPLSFYAQQAYQSLSGADATEAAAFLAVTEPPAAREKFRADIEQAGAYLRAVTAADSAPATRADLTTLDSGIPEYTMLIGQARADSRDGLPVGECAPRELVRPGDGVPGCRRDHRRPVRHRVLRCAAMADLTYQSAGAASPGYGRATAAGRAATAWYAVHRVVRDLDNGGDYPDAVYLAIGSGAATSPAVIQQREAALAQQAGPGHPATSASAFADVEADLAAGISADHSSFTAAASRGDDALGGLAAGMGIASLLMSAGCAWGLSRRIAEYR